ncbi:MAG: DHA2 family efflux MFS transporter permease subunit [Gemmatimonadaceae bacterium]
MTAAAKAVQSPAGRWILAASILGSGAVFLEGSVVSVAVPSIGRDLGLGVAGLQWVMNGYLLTLSALMLFGGALGDRGSRPRVFGIGLIGFAISSVACGLAPNVILLIAARVIQGIFGALVVPNSLALLETTFHAEARGAAIGKWAAWSGVSTALGPLAGGWLVDAASWRFVFFSIVPFAVAAAWIAFRHESATGKQRHEASSLDYTGAILATLGLAGVVGALITGPDAGFTSPIVLATLAGGIVCLAAFLFVESRAQPPLLPLDVFEHREFVAANLNTLFVYAALNGLFFLLMLQLQNGLHYSALIAGASLLPVNALLLFLSPRSGHLAERIGPRLPMALGSLLAAIGMLLFVRVRPGANYLTTLLPALIVFGIGLGVLVAPLTTVALRSLGERRAGIASGVNNATARLAGLLATAAIPVAAGLGGSRKPTGPALATAFTRAMIISAALCGIGALVAATMISGKKRKSET